MTTARAREIPAQIAGNLRAAEAGRSCGLSARPRNNSSKRDWCFAARAINRPRQRRTRPRKAKKRIWSDDHATSHQARLVGCAPPFRDLFGCRAADDEPPQRRLLLFKPMNLELGAPCRAARRRLPCSNLQHSGAMRPSGRCRNRESHPARDGRAPSCGPCSPPPAASGWLSWRSSKPGTLCRPSPTSTSACCATSASSATRSPMPAGTAATALLRPDLSRWA